MVITDDPKLSSKTQETESKVNPQTTSEEQLESIRKKLKTDKIKSKTVTPSVSSFKDTIDPELKCPPELDIAEEKKRK